jgi:hypothetical protein
MHENFKYTCQGFTGLDEAYDNHFFCTLTLFWTFYNNVRGLSYTDTDNNIHRDFFLPYKISVFLSKTYKRIDQSKWPRRHLYHFILGVSNAKKFLIIISRRAQQRTQVWRESELVAPPNCLPNIKRSHAWEEELKVMSFIVCCWTSRCLASTSSLRSTNPLLNSTYFLVRERSSVAFAGTPWTLLTHKTLYSRKKRAIGSSTPHVIRLSHLQQNFHIPLRSTGGVILLLLLLFRDNNNVKTGLTTCSSHTKAPLSCLSSSAVWRNYIPTSLFNHGQSSWSACSCERRPMCIIIIIIKGVARGC